MVENSRMFIDDEAEASSEEENAQIAPETEEERYVFNAPADADKDDGYLHHLNANNENVFGDPDSDEEARLLAARYENDYGNEVVDDDMDTSEDEGPDPKKRKPLDSEEDVTTVSEENNTESSILYRSVPDFEVDKLNTSKSQIVFVPGKTSCQKNTELSSTESETSYVYSLQIHLGKHINGSEQDWKDFQTVYYIMYAASWLASKDKHDITTHFWPINKYGLRNKDLLSYKKMLRNIIYNKNEGCHLCEVHVHTDDALLAFSKLLQNSAKMFVGQNSPMSELKTKLEQCVQGPRAKTLIEAMFTSTVDLARGLVQLGESMGTVPSGQNQLHWCTVASESVLQVAQSEVDPATNIETVLRGEYFWNLCGRENVIESLFRNNSTLKETLATNLMEGQVFLDEFPAYPFTNQNVRNMIAYTEVPGSVSYELSKSLTDKSSNAGYQERRINAPLSTDTLHDRIEKMCESLYTFEDRFNLIKSAIISDHSDQPDWWGYMQKFALHVEEHIGFDGYVFNLTKEKCKGFRYGSHYINIMWMIANDAELLSKHQNLRIIVQFMRDISFLIKPRDPVPNFWIHGEAASGKSILADNCRETGFKGQMENCAAESNQGGFCDTKKKIFVFHEGAPSKTNNNQNNEQGKSNLKNNFGNQKKDLTVRRMNAKTGEVDKFKFNNESQSWYLVNFELDGVDKAILDRAMCKNSNVTASNARPVSTLACEAAKTAAIEFKKIAGDHLRVQFIIYNGYDALDRFVPTVDPDSGLFPWVSENIKHHMPKLASQGICNPRQAGYARLIARSYMLHSMVVALQHGLDVPSQKLIQKLKKCLKPGDTQSRQAKVVDLLQNLSYVPEGETRWKPKPYMDRFLTTADWLCKECLAFLDFSAIVFGFACQADLSTEANLNGVIVALKQVCYNFANEEKVRADDRGLPADSPDYLEFKFGKDSLINLIIGMLNINTKSHKRSFDTVNSALKTISQMVVGGDNDKSKAQGITFVDKACTRVHKGLLAQVMTPEEKECLMFIYESSAVDEADDSDIQEFMRDNSVNTVLLSNLKTFIRSQKPTKEPGCQFSNVGVCIEQFENRAEIVNGNKVVNHDGIQLYVTSSFFNLCFSHDNYEANSIHQGFSNIGKILGIDPKKGKFLITEPNRPEELTPGVVQCTQHTISHQVHSTDRTIENGRYIEKASRQFCSPFMTSALTKKCRKRSSIRGKNEDLEDSYNWMAYRKCEICKWFLDGEGDGQKMINLFFNECVSQRAIHHNMNLRFKS